MIRRHLLALPALALPLLAAAARAQTTPRPARLGFIASSGNPDRVAYRGFRARLQELGWTEGVSLATSFHNPGRVDAVTLRETALAALAGQPDLVVVDGRLATQALAAATRTVPIITMLGLDPVETGLIQSLARPGGNITGVTLFSDLLNVKRMEMLMEIAPGARRIGIVSTNPAGAIEVAASQVAARGLSPQRIVINGAPLIEASLSPAALAGIDALIVLSDSVLDSWPARVVASVAAAGKPVIYPERQYTLAGGLLSYGPDVDTPFRRLAELVDQVLRGANPATIPFERVSRFELVANARAAAAIGLALPASILALADEVIE